ncbi:hypothetical protein D3C72_2443340 [compost metagenome]
MVAFHLDPDEYRQAQAHFVAIEAGVVATDNPGFLQQADPAQAGGCGQADFLGQLHVGQATVALQGDENPVVQGVESKVWHKWLV